MPTVSLIYCIFFKRDSLLATLSGVQIYLKLSYNFSVIPISISFIFGIMHMIKHGKTKFITVH